MSVVISLVFKCLFEDTVTDQSLINLYNFSNDNIIAQNRNYTFSKNNGFLILKKSDIHIGMWKEYLINLTRIKNE